MANEHTAALENQNKELKRMLLKIVESSYVTPQGGDVFRAVPYAALNEASELLSSFGL